MKNREAAEHITDTLLALAKLVTTSVTKIDGMNSEGKVSSDEAALYRQSVMGPLDEMLRANLSGIFELYPELRHKCPCCAYPPEEGVND
ncbi:MULTISPECIES: hypothetical protein [Pantoea]|uniref:Uncharacterized protein n=1 Tax=Pantoea anthophila TaxID=470931 RepID=A0ABY2ZM59_9GAMM|nr:MULTISPECIES: hypothetical protein [Pantoea]KAA5974396.1 hypothetical protein F3I51_06625 [Pantoea sp. M_6]KAA5978342.1 hypothetical protein F3I52_08375 [Pantoea sp. M_8]KAA5989903.1 hypothetical protein F3I47_13695 [Pantoea sp. M_10]KAA6002866.1 hypothetical protein F3I50_00975 [Pantoea sp. M_5]TPV33685.1 hypothetical protein FJW00_01165 [Pantoea anthophila]